MSREMRHHLEELTNSYISSGMDPGEAHLAARRRFGGVMQIEERCRDEHGFIWLGQFANDLRFALRSLCRAPCFSATILLTMVLGIGVTSVVFNLTADIILFSLPYPNPDQLFFIGFKDRQNSAQYNLTGIQFQAHQEQTRAFEEFAAADRVPAAVAVGGEPVAADVLGISSDCFHTLGKRPALGRGFLPEEYHAGAASVVVISDSFWREHFNSAPDVLGRSIAIDRQPYTIVGVLPQSQEFPAFFASDIFHPLVLKVDPSKPFDSSLFVIGRLKRGVTIEQALGDLSAAKLPTLPQWAVDTLAEQSPVLTRIGDLNRPDADWLILGAGVLLYCISCLNAMNLILIRLLGRRRELSIRFAIGGSRRQVLQLLVIECSGLSLVAGLVVILAARFVFPPLFVLLTGQEAAIYVNYWDWSTLTCIIGLSMLANLGVIAVPVLRLFRADTNAGLRDGGPTSGESRGAGRARSLIVVLQVAIAVILLAGTGLMMRSFARLHQLDLGFDPVGKVKVQVNLPRDYDLKPAARIQLFERLQRSLSAIPGVRSASYGMDSIFLGSFGGGAQLQMGDGTFQPVDVREVSHEFPDTAGLVMKRGRWLSGQRGKVEAVINETLARAIFGDRDPIGLDFTIKGWRFPKTVVGVVGDVRDSVRSQAGMRFYIPTWMWPENVDTLVLRLDGDPKNEFSDLVRRAIYNVEPRLIVSTVSSIDELVNDTMWAERYAFMILKGLAAIALGLTVVGCFSVVSYTVDRRMTEFGVRIALGAQTADLNRLVMKRGLATTAIGIAAGTTCAFALVRYMSSLLFETPPFDPWVYLGVGALLMASGAIACWMPARRAARADVVKLLRAD